MVELSLGEARAAAVGYAGDVFNTCVYLRRLGVPAAFATALGDGDPFSSAILALMAAEGVDAGLVTSVPGRVPGLYAIERDPSGERRFFYWRDQAPVREFFQLADLDRFRSAVRAADLFYLSGITLAVIGDEGRAALHDLLGELVAAGVPIAFDPNYRPRLWTSREAAARAIDSVIGRCRIVSASALDVEALTLTSLGEVAADWAARGPQVIARADDGAIEIHDADAVARLPTSAMIQAIDTTGAGDSFNAAYLASRLAARPVAEAVAAAQALAGRVVGFPGAIIPRSEMA
jgi:2-dehydro-3-deoxygluconokinase